MPILALFLEFVAAVECASAYPVNINPLLVPDFLIFLSTNFYGNSYVLF